MQYEPLRALDLLKRGTGRPDTRFREGQEEAIRHLVEDRRRQLLVQKTGWGKSFVYFITTRLLREAGLGPTLLVSPLLALMRNQIAAAERMDVRAETINSDNQDEWDRVEQAVGAGAVDILLISPERLANERFRERVLADAAARIALLVIDEAHCISDWGHDFRPHYRLIERIVRDLPPNLRLLATTATANDRVMTDLEAILGPDLQVLRGDLHRPSLSLPALDGDPRGISPPPLPPLPASPSPELVTEAVAFLRRSSRPVEPRRQWPTRKRIAPEHQAQPGRVLCVWNDAGWGRLVSRGKLQDGRFSNELVGACAALLREWRPDPSPTWVAAVPSLRHPHLVPDFARRLAHALDLPFSDVLKKTGSRPEQKTMENSDRQARNVLGSLVVAKEAILAGPVLLVDDVVDSQWTFTVAAWELRRRGCGPVWPLALANAGGGS